MPPRCSIVFFFFFQAEDGIRDHCVTGVQTCALPISVYGVMASVMGVGAVVGGLISAARPRPRGRALCLAAIGWGIAILAAAAAPSLTLELVALFFVGYGSITFNSLAKTTLQLAAKPEMR